MADYINELVADNLRTLMERAEMSQVALAKKSGVAQTTIGLYMSPDNRKPSASGKPASGKLTEVAMLADGLGVEAWELLLPKGAAVQGGKLMQGWPLSPELLAALQNASPEMRSTIEAAARGLLRLPPGGAQETPGAAA